MRHLQHLLLPLLLFTALSCGDGVADPDGVAALDEARERWRREAITAYSVETRYMCFCPSPAGVWARLEVRNGVVVSAVPLDSTGAPTTTEGWYTVERMFEMLDRNMRTEGPATVTYDAELGYPRSGSLYCSPDVLDCGLSFEFRNLTRLD